QDKVPAPQDKVPAPQDKVPAPQDKVPAPQDAARGLEGGGRRGTVELGALSDSAPLPRWMGGTLGTFRTHVKRFQDTLEEDFLARRIHSRGPVKGYPRSAMRFGEHVARMMSEGHTPPEDPEASVSEYLEALRNDEVDAPASEKVVGATGVRRFVRFLEAGGSA
ncbi:MAG: hypothetical protein AB2A00_40375, partial [Myxococcota bacterium]